jgi:hypothetical protein
MSRLPVPDLESATGATAEIYAQIKKSIGNVPNTFAAIGAHGPAALKAVLWIPQNLQKRLRLARYLHFTHDPARVIHNADAGLLDRYVQSSKMVHAALPLLMLEAVTTDLVSPSA